MDLTEFEERKVEQLFEELAAHQETAPESSTATDLEWRRYLKARGAIWKKAAGYGQRIVNALARRVYRTAENRAARH